MKGFSEIESIPVCFLCWQNVCGIFRKILVTIFTCITWDSVCSDKLMDVSPYLTSDSHQQSSPYSIHYFGTCLYVNILLNSAKSFGTNEHTNFSLLRTLKEFVYQFIFFFHINKEYAIILVLIRFPGIIHVRFLISIFFFHTAT